MSEHSRGYAPTSLTKKLLLLRRTVTISANPMGPEFLSGLMTAVTEILVDDALVGLLATAVSDRQPFGRPSAITAMELLVDLNAEMQQHGRILPATWVSLAMAFAPGALIPEGELRDITARLDGLDAVLALVPVNPNEETALRNAAVTKDGPWNYAPQATRLVERNYEGSRGLLTFIVGGRQYRFEIPLSYLHGPAPVAQGERP